MTISVPVFHFKVCATICLRRFNTGETSITTYRRTRAGNQGGSPLPTHRRQGRISRLPLCTRCLDAIQLSALLAAVAISLIMVRGKVGVKLWAQLLTVQRLRLLATDQV